MNRDVAAVQQVPPTLFTRKLAFPCRIVHMYSVRVDELNAHGIHMALRQSFLLSWIAEIRKPDNHRPAVFAAQAAIGPDLDEQVGR